MALPSRQIPFTRLVLEKQTKIKLEGSKESLAGSQWRWQAQSCWSERRLGMTLRNDKSENRDDGRSKAHETQSRELWPLSDLNPADPDGQAGRRRMSRSTASQ